MDNDENKPKQHEPSKTDRRNFYIAVVMFSIFEILIFFKLLESDKWAPLAWAGLAFVVLFIVLPKVGTRILFLVIGLLMLSGAVTLVESCSRSERIRNQLGEPNSEPGGIFPWR